MTNNQLINLAERKVKTLTSAIKQSAFTSIRQELECELELASFALSALQERQKSALLDVRECETRAGTGKIDERRGGYSFSNPEAKCPDCNGSGEYYPTPLVIAEIVSKYGDPEAFGERELRPVADIQRMPYNSKLYSMPLKSPKILAGHTLVPAIPSQDMLAAGGDTYVRCGDINEYQTDAARRIWCAMLQVLPETAGATAATVIPKEATISNIKTLCPAGMNQTEFASGWNDCRENRITHGQLPPIIKGIDAKARGWNACRAAMILQEAAPCTK